MKIGLMGCEFVSPNKGCEALTYSIVSVLNKINMIKKDTIIYNFSETEIGDIAKEFTKFKFVKVNPKFKDISFKFIRALSECDVIFDATMGDSFSDIYSEKFYNGLVLKKRIAQFFCKNYILLPQTYGPFKTKKTESKAKKVFDHALKIYCRDGMSKELLEDVFGIKDVELMTDMAFILPFNKSMYSNTLNDKIKIGINVSGLLYKGGFLSANQFDLTLNYKEYIEKVIDKLAQNSKYEIHIIPHVIDLNENAHDDDYKVSKQIKEKYSECILAPVFSNPIQAKSYIANMDIFIGSRMHSTIAAFSSNVITIPVSYSRKFEGLFNSLNYKYVINGKEHNTDSAFNKTMEFIENNNELKKAQKDSQEYIDKKKKEFELSIEKCIKDALKQKSEE